MERKELGRKRRQMQRRRWVKKAGKISISVVIGLLMITGIWKIASPRMTKIRAFFPEEGQIATVQAAEPEMSDGSGSAGILELQKTIPPNEVPGWQYSKEGWWYAPSESTYYANGWLELDGKQYHFDLNGYMDTGWKAIGGKGCYFDQDGM